MSTVVAVLETMVALGKSWSKDVPIATTSDLTLPGTGLRTSPVVSGTLVGTALAIMGVVGRLPVAIRWVSLLGTLPLVLLERRLREAAGSPERGLAARLKALIPAEEPTRRS